MDAVEAQGPAVYRLDNGLVVVLEEDHRTDSVAMVLRYGVGSRDEAPGRTGTAHLFEHLMFEGSEHVPGNSFDEWLTAAGGTNNAFTWEDATSYVMSFPSGATDLALFLESDRMGWLADGLGAAGLRNQQDIVLRERAEYEAAPGGMDGDALKWLFYPDGHPYRHPVLGAEPDVRGFDLAAVREFSSERYRPRNAVLVLIGHFDETIMLERVRHWFGEVPDTGPPPDRVAEVDGPWREVDGVYYDDVDRPTLYLAWPGPPVSDSDRAALDVLSAVLSYGRGTRLDDRLYYRRKLTTDCSAWFAADELSGRFVVYATSGSAPLRRIAAISERAVRSVVRRPPTEQELDLARSRLRADVLDRLENIEDRADEYADCQAIFGTPTCWTERHLPALDAVTADDVVRVARQWLIDGPRTSLSVVAPGERAAYRDAIAVSPP